MSSERLRHSVLPEMREAFVRAVDSGRRAYAMTYGVGPRCEVDNCDTPFDRVEPVQIDPTLKHRGVGNLCMNHRGKLASGAGSG